MNKWDFRWVYFCTFWFFNNANVFMNSDVIFNAIKTKCVENGLEEQCIASGSHCAAVLICMQAYLQLWNVSPLRLSPHGLSQRPPEQVKNPWDVNSTVSRWATCAQWDLSDVFLFAKGTVKHSARPPGSHMGTRHPGTRGDRLSGAE